MYRDQREHCPRCGTDLVGGGSTRVCSNCQGVWIGIGSVEEMTAQMQNPPHPSPLQFGVETREKLACPACTQPMSTVLLHGVAVDVCVKQQHGVWFDATELATMLVRAAKIEPDAT